MTSQGASSALCKCMISNTPTVLRISRLDNAILSITISILSGVVPKRQATGGINQMAEGIPELSNVLSETISLRNPCRQTLCFRINSAVVQAEGSPERLTK